VSRGGITDLVCSLALAGMSPDQIRAGMELFAKEVIPHFRQAADSALAETVATQALQ
jgi:hypothetical protein